MPPVLRRHYRTVILGCCFLVLFVNQGLPATSFNVYQTYIVELPGVGAVGGSAVLTVRAFVSLVVMLVVGPLYRRFDVRYGVLGATLCTAVGFTIYGFFPTLAGLLAGSVLTGVGYGLGGMVATTLILGRWFKGGLGMAAGFIGMGSGIASFVIPALAAEVIEHAGLAAAFFGEAVLAGVCAVFFVVFLRSDPASLGLAPYQAKRRPPRDRQGHVASEASAAVAAETDAPHCRRMPCHALTRDDLPSRDKRLMMTAMFLLGGVAITGFGYFSVLLTSVGVNPLAAAFITSLGGACLAAGKLLCGWTFDKLGTRSGTLIFFAVLITGLVLCATVGIGGATGGFFAALAYCTGIAVATTGITVWSLELSGPSSMLANVRDFNLAYAAGGFAFNMMPGLLMQATGTYTTTYGALTAFAVVSAIVIAVVYGRRRIETAVNKPSTSQS